MEGRRAASVPSHFSTQRNLQLCLLCRCVGPCSHGRNPVLTASLDYRSVAGVHLVLVDCPHFATSLIFIQLIL
jgi:hypothetical protein